MVWRSVKDSFLNHQPGRSSVRSRALSLNLKGAFPQSPGRRRHFLSLSIYSVTPLMPVILAESFENPWGGTLKRKKEDEICTSSLSSSTIPLTSGIEEAPQLLLSVFLFYHNSPCIGNKIFFRGSGTPLRSSILAQPLRVPLPSLSARSLPHLSAYSATRW